LQRELVNAFEDNGSRGQTGSGFLFARRDIGHNGIHNFLFGCEFESRGGSVLAESGWRPEGGVLADLRATPPTEPAGRVDLLPEVTL
jgi:hypothetical protein